MGPLREGDEVAAGDLVGDAPKALESDPPLEGGGEQAVIPAGVTRMRTAGQRSSGNGCANGVADWGS